VPTHLSENIVKFYEKLHSIDVKYTSLVFTTVQKYTFLRVTSKVIQKLSDGPALPLFFLLYWYQGNPAPLSFAAYVSFWVIYHELGVKQIFHRSRPSTSNGQKGFSFPSSHSFASGIILIICLLFPMPWQLLLILLAVINAANRPAVGVHYIADVIAGLSLGVIVAASWPLILGIAKVALP
jgi:membrane-associated phospholipid phosphatase